MSSQTDMKFLKPFVEGTLNTLKIQCKTEAKYTQPFLKSKAPPMAQVHIASLLGLVSERFKGSVALCFPEKTFLNLMGKMLDEEFTNIEEVKDGAGELLNIIFGHAKKVLNEEGHDFQKSLPSVISGENIKVNYMTSEPVLVLPFESDAGIFYLEVGVENK